MPLGKNIQNIGVMGAPLNGTRRNTPAAYAGRQKQYFASETSKFIQEYAKYSSDYFLAQVQGTNPEDFYTWEDQLIRMADITGPAAATSKILDDYKTVLFANPAIDYIPRGAKINAAGSIWLVTNPLNISSVSANTIAERCNAVWNHLDYYGNVISEPIVVDTGAAKAADNDKQEYVLITKGYYNVKAQYNEYTAQLGQNSRIILGSKAYSVHGFTDFIQEFTGDYGTVHMCEFTLYFEEPNAELDDLERHIAGGRTFSWDIDITGPQEITAGNTAVFQAVSQRDGQTVTSTEEHPIFYQWSSSAEEIATVSETGEVTAVSEGICQILCALVQNPSIISSVPVSVTQAGGDAHIAFTAMPPQAMNAFQSIEVSAAYYENGTRTEDVLAWELQGADASAYSYEVFGNTAKITCWGPSEKPLQVAARFKNYTVAASIELLGV